MATTDPPHPRLTEGIVTELLRQRHSAPGNGGAGEHAFLAQVRNAAGFDANRTFDAVTVGLWPSRGLPVDVWEIKVSRSDWLNELRKPAKAEDACKIADRFWIVAPKGCVKDGELPPTWGLLEVHGDGTDAKPWKLKVKHQAPWLPERSQRAKPPPLDRGLVVGLLRSAPGAIPGGGVKSAEEIALRDAHDKGFGKGIEEGKRLALNPTAERQRQAWLTFQEALREHGLDQWGDSPTSLTEHAGAIAATVKGQTAERGADDRLKFARGSLVRAIEAIDGIIGTGD